MTREQTRKRRSALISALNRREVATSQAAMSRYADVNASTVQGGTRRNADGFADALARAEGNFYIDAEPKEVPDFAEFRDRFFGSKTPSHQVEWFKTIAENDLSLILCPPNFGKITGLIEYICWRVARDRDVRVLYISKTQAFARKGLYAIKQRLSDASSYEANGYANLVAEHGPFKPGKDDRSTPWSADLVFTSPPYTSFREWDDAGFQAYWNDFDSIFSQLGRLLDSAGRLVVEMSNVRQVDGQVRPVAFEAAHRLREWFQFHGEIVRCNTGDEAAAPGYNHAYLLVYDPKTKSDVS